MKLYKHITISLLSALLAMVMVYGGYTIYAADEELDGNFRAPGLEFEEALEFYHDEMNQYFNTKITALNLLLEEEDFFEKEEFKAPEDGACAEENVSTFCVAEGALQIYLDYALVLDIVAGQLAAIEDDDELEDVIERTVERNEKIVPEYDIAKTAMDTTLAAFNEYRLAYPMHQQYEEVIEDLIKYKFQLKDLRLETDEFPLRFIDSSTTQCP